MGGEIKKVPLSEREEGHMQNLYDLGLKALEDLRGGKLSPFGKNHGILSSNHKDLCQA